VFVGIGGRRCWAPSAAPAGTTPETTGGATSPQTIEHVGEVTAASLAKNKRAADGGDEVETATLSVVGLVTGGRRYGEAFCRDYDASQLRNHPQKIHPITSSHPLHHIRHPTSRCSEVTALKRSRNEPPCLQRMSLPSGPKTRPPSEGATPGGDYGDGLTMGIHLRKDCHCKYVVCRIF
jgi:hypothetical protein